MNTWCRKFVFQAVQHTKQKLSLPQSIAGITGNVVACGTLQT